MTRESRDVGRMRDEIREESLTKKRYAYPRSNMNKKQQLQGPWCMCNMLDSEVRNILYSYIYLSRICTLMTLMTFEKAEV